MKEIKKIILILLLSCASIICVDAKSFISEEYVSLNNAVLFRSDDFEIYLELKSLSFSTSDELGMLSGYSKRKKEPMYYYHYIFYFYDSNYNEIGSADGYNGMWHEASKSSTGTFLGQVINKDYIYDEYSLEQVKYYKLFVEPANKKTAENYIYKNIKKNKDGLDPIVDKKTENMKYTIVKNNSANNKPSTNVGGTTITGEPVVSNYSLEIDVTKNKVFKVREFVRVENKKQGGAIGKTIRKKYELLPEKIVKIENFFNEGLVDEKSYNSFNQIIINEDSVSFGYDISFEKDKNKDNDIIRYPISGDIDIPVEMISFKLNMPDEFDISTMKLISSNGAEINKDNYIYKVDENSIVVNYLVKVNPSEKVVFELTLPNNYFDNNSSTNLYIIIFITACLVLFFVVSIFFFINKKKKVDVVIEQEI